MTLSNIETEYLIIRIAKVGIIVNIDFTGSKFYAAKEDTADNVIKYMARTIPNRENLIVARQLLSPRDLETIHSQTNIS